MSASDPELKHLTRWCSISSSQRRTVFQHGSSHVESRFVQFYTFFFPHLCLISFTYTTHGTKKNNNTESHDQLLTNTDETHKPARLKKKKNASLAPEQMGWLRSVAARQPDCNPAFSLLPPLHLEVNQTDEKIKKNQATKMVKSCHKIWNICISRLLSPANDGSCCFLLVYATTKNREVKDD